MKRWLLILAALLMLLTACSQASVEEPEPTARYTDEPEPTSAQREAPYTVGSAYSCIWERERDRKWEEDIAFFADEYLHPNLGHPLLSDRSTTVRIFNDPVLRYSTTSLKSFFDEAVRDEFVRLVNELIFDVPYIDDISISIRLAEIAALLEDGHSFVRVPVEEAFPLYIVPVAGADGPEWAVDFAPSKYRDILGWRLTAINGVPVLDIADLMRPFVSYEAEPWFLFVAMRYRMLLNCGVLRYIGIMGPERSAVMTLEGPNGETRELEMLSRAAEAMWHDAAGYHSDSGKAEGDTGTLLMERYPEKDVWYTLLRGGEALYIRFNTCVVDESTGGIVEDAFDAAENAGKLEKVIVDFRSNTGGYADLSGNFLPLATALKTSGAEVYVLIDGGSFSAGVGIPAMLKRRIEGVTLIGTPAGQPTAFFFSGKFELPNSGIYCQCSSTYGDFWPGNDDLSLMPDVTVERSYEDYIEGVDSVLEYILDGSVSPQ
ncbi:MAG: hypothetical protein J5772_00620 [Clostridia bacterium]|nr:hypothetical protein [Clostridia bacterium]